MRLCALCILFYFFFLVRIGIFHSHIVIYALMLPCARRRRRHDTAQIHSTIYFRMSGQTTTATTMSTMADKVFYIYTHSHIAHYTKSEYIMSIYYMQVISYIRNKNLSYFPSTTHSLLASPSTLSLPPPVSVRLSHTRQMSSVAAS